MPVGRPRKHPDDKARRKAYHKSESERYKTDPEYRNKVKAKNRAYYQRRQYTDNPTCSTCGEMISTSSKTGKCHKHAMEDYYNRLRESLYDTENGV